MIEDCTLDWRYFKIKFVKSNRFLKSLEVNWKLSGIPKYVRGTPENDIIILKEHLVNFEKVFKKYINEFLILGLDVPEMEVIYYRVADPEDIEISRKKVE